MVGDIIRGEVIGTTLSIYQNGTLLGSVTATSLSSGLFGFLESPAILSTDVGITNWVGGGTTSGMFGMGWTYIGNNQVMRNDSLAPGASYPPITVTVNVGGMASSPQVNQACAVGGGLTKPVCSTDSVVIVGGLKPCSPPAVTITTPGHNVSSGGYPVSSTASVITGQQVICLVQFTFTGGSTPLPTLTDTQGILGLLYAFGQTNTFGTTQNWALYQGVANATGSLTVTSNSPGGSGEGNLYISLLSPTSNVGFLNSSHSSGNSLNPNGTLTPDYMPYNTVSPSYTLPGSQPWDLVLAAFGSSTEDPPLIFGVVFSAQLATGTTAPTGWNFYNSDSDSVTRWFNYAPC